MTTRAKATRGHVPMGGIFTTWACALDPVRFAHACGVTLDDWQRDVLLSTAPRLLMACSRQSGKSLVAALLALHTAVYTDGATVLCLSPSLRQSQELFRKVLTLLAQATSATSVSGVRGALSIPTVAETALTLTLTNHSRILALPGSAATVRGFSAVTLLILDEAAHVSAELYYSMLPVLAVSGGRLVLLSSCYGKRGIFWEAWREPANGEPELIPWHKVRVPATQCPRIPAAFLAEQERIMGRWWFRSEYLAEFLDAHTAAFREEDIERAFSEDYQVWDLPNLDIHLRAMQTPLRTDSSESSDRHRQQQPTGDKWDPWELGKILERGT